MQWATLARLSGQPPEIAFNLALATLFSWIGLGAYGLALNLAKRRRVAVAAALFLVFAGNLEPLEQLPRLLKRYEAYRGYGENASAGPLRPFDWEEFTSAAPFDLWRASRVILRDASSGDGRTVNEFPYFSFILGDLHAHCSALALNLLLLHVLLAIWLRKEESALTWAECALRAPHAPLLLCLLAGGLYWYNGWEPLPLAILLAAMFLCDRNDWTIRPVFAPLSAAAFGALIFGMGLFGFFYLYLREFEPPIQAADGAPSWKAALLIVKPRPWALASSVRELFVFWGIVWLPLILAILRRVWRLARDFGMNRYLGLAAAAALFGAAVLALESGGLAAPICLALAAGAGALAWSANRSEAEQFAARLAFAGFCAIFIAEVVYVQDGMGEGYQRYNTVFKLYYPAYAYLALAAVIFLWQQNRTLGLAKRRAAQWALRIGMIGLAGLGAVYPYMATWARTDGFFAIGGEDGLRGARINEAMRRRTLDGLEHLGAAEDSPDDLAAIRWLKANIEGRPHILEAAGPAYSETGRVSAYTGLPTVIGWDNHECQWRGWRYYPAVQRRQDNVDQIFQSASPFAAAPLLRRYGIEYVFAGRLERERYGEESLEKFALIGREAFRSGATRVYALGGGAIARFGGADIPIPAPRFDDTLTTQGAAAGGFAAIELPARTAAE
ncbi:MAG: hypothetical protein BWZ10_00811 [candidate division BRC1 bacterium ADurb.BinA364]|nr:MAG: hypothetical protein BWZ10_00811 [candidate division BRC1 bacterium ADurb.BinA364]